MALRSHCNRTESIQQLIVDRLPFTCGPQCPIYSHYYQVELRTMHIRNVRMKLRTSGCSWHSWFGHAFIVSITILSWQSCFVHAFVVSFTALSLSFEDQPDYSEVIATMLTSRGGSSLGAGGWTHAAHGTLPKPPLTISNNWMKRKKKKREWREEIEEENEPP